MNAQKGILRIIKVCRILVVISVVISFIKIIQYFPSLAFFEDFISVLGDWFFITDHKNPNPFATFPPLLSIPSAQWLGICIATVIFLKTVIWILQGLLDD